MSTLSICMIVKNEEKILEKTLNSIHKFADEIIIVDTGSTDRTVEIAKKFTSKVYYFQWVDDFAAAYNYSHSFATCDYTARWDADFELISGQVNLQALKKRNFDAADIINFTWNIELDSNGLALRSQMRDIIHKRGVFKWVSQIHAHVEPIKSNLVPVQKNYPEIVINHIKDPIDKAWRYKQTRDILENNIKKQPKNQYLLKMYGDSLLFEGDYKNALNYYHKCLELGENKYYPDLAYVLEKTILCLINLKQFQKANSIYNKYCATIKNLKSVMLIYADLLAFTNPTEAINTYLTFLNTPTLQQDKDLDYSADRFLAHPHRMLFKLYLQNGNKIQAFSEILSLLTTSISFKEKLKYFILIFAIPFFKSKNIV